MNSFDLWMIDLEYNIMVFQWGIDIFYIGMMHD